MSDSKTQDRKERVPLGVPRSKLGVTPKIKGYQFRWINDEPGRIQAAAQAGYQHVKYDEIDGVGQFNVVPTTAGMGSVVSKVVEYREGGHPLHAYLMKIQDAFHKETKEMKAQEVASTEQSLRALNDLDPRENQLYGNINLK